MYRRSLTNQFGKFTLVDCGERASTSPPTARTVDQRREYKGEKPARYCQPPTSAPEVSANALENEGKRRPKGGGIPQGTVSDPLRSAETQTKKKNIQTSEIHIHRVGERKLPSIDHEHESSQLLPQGEVTAPRKGYADASEDSGSDHSIEGMRKKRRLTDVRLVSAKKPREMIRMEREQVAPKEGELTPMRVSQGEVHRRSFDLFLADSYIPNKGMPCERVAHVLERDRCSMMAVKKPMGVKKPIELGQASLPLGG